MLLWYFLADMSSCDGAHMAYEAENVYYLEPHGNCWLTAVVELFSSITETCQNLCNTSPWEGQCPDLTFPAGNALWHITRDSRSCLLFHPLLLSGLGTTCQWGTWVCIHQSSHSEVLSLAQGHLHQPAPGLCSWVRILMLDPSLPAIALAPTFHFNQKVPCNTKSQSSRILRSQCLQLVSIMDWVVLWHPLNNTSICNNHSKCLVCSCLPHRTTPVIGF